MHSWPTFYTGPTTAPLAHFHAMSIATKAYYSANTLPLSYPTCFEFPQPFQLQPPVFHHTHNNMHMYPAVVGTMPFIPASCYSAVPDILEYASLSSDFGPISSFLGDFNCSACGFHACNVDSPLEFLANVVERAHMHESTLITTMYYVAKLMGMSAQLPSPCSRCVFATCAVLATKYLSDDCVSVNSTWAKLVGLPVSQICAYERELLRIFEYNLNVPPGDYTTLEYAFRHDLVSEFFHVQRIEDMSNDEDYGHFNTVPDSTATTTSESKPVSASRGTTEVDPAIFITAEYQDILKDLYAMDE